MKFLKTIILFSMLLLLFGCTENKEQGNNTTADDLQQEIDLPPEPGAIGEGEPIEADAAATGGAYWENYEEKGFARPFDKNYREVFSVTPRIVKTYNDEAVPVSVQVNYADALIYRYGYYYTGTGWQKFKFEEQGVQGSNWIKSNAMVDISINEDYLDYGTNYFVTYSCVRENMEWKCGCSDINGKCNQWMLNENLVLKDSLPAEPAEPGEIILGRIDQYFGRGNVVRSDSKVELMASVNSETDISAKLQNPRFVIMNESGDIEEIPANAYSDYECWSSAREGREYYVCYASFSADYLVDNDSLKVKVVVDDMENLGSNSDMLYVDDNLFDLALGDISIWIMGTPYAYGSDQVKTLQLGYRDAEYNTRGSVSINRYDEAIWLEPDLVRRLNNGYKPVYDMANVYVRIISEEAYYDSGWSYVWESGNMIFEVESRNQGLARSLMENYSSRYAPHDIEYTMPNYQTFLVNYTITDVYYNDTKYVFISQGYSEESDFKVYYARYSIRDNETEVSLLPTHDNEADVSVVLGQEEAINGLLQDEITCDYSEDIYVDNYDKIVTRCERSYGTSFYWTGITSDFDYNYLVFISMEDLEYNGEAPQLVHSYLSKMS